MTTRTIILKPQSGVVLLVSMIMLLLLTIIGITGMQTTGLEEKMAGNMRDHNVAFQAAETALRDAEHDILGLRTSANKHPDYPDPQTHLVGRTGFSADCGKSTTSNQNDDGLCYGYPTVKAWLPVGSFDPMKGAPSVEYGYFTGATAITGLSAQPRYLIEVFKQPVAGSSCDYHYRITVRAQGNNDTSVVMLQETYKSCL
jgi:type IV pilus assembly protein PilX